MLDIWPSRCIWNIGNWKWVELAGWLVGGYLLVCWSIKCGDSRQHGSAILGCGVIYFLKFMSIQWLCHFLYFLVLFHVELCSQSEVDPTVEKRHSLLLGPGGLVYSNCFSAHTFHTTTGMVLAVSMTLFINTLRHSNGYSWAYHVTF